MSWLLDKIKGFLGLKAPAKRDILAELNIYVVKDERLEERIRVTKELYGKLNEIVSLKTRVAKAPEEILDKLIELMNEVNEIIDKVATPYWRALTRKGSAELMWAWSEIHARFIDMAATLRNWFERLHKGDVSEVEKPRLPREVLVQSLLSMIINEYVSRTLVLVKASWDAEDVTPSWVGAVQPQASLGPAMAPSTYNVEELIRQLAGKEREG